MISLAFLHITYRERHDETTCKEDIVAHMESVTHRHVNSYKGTEHAYDLPSLNPFLKRLGRVFK